VKKSLLVAAAALPCTSCGNPNGLYPVSGTVTYRGEPAAGAFVFLYRPGIDSQSDQTRMGVVRPDGSYTIDSGPLGKGATPGEYVVLVRWKDERPRAGPHRGAAPDRLRGRYYDPAHPLLHAQVRAQTNQLPPIELTD
jgi:hypothetical protein